jgi:DNA mismatch endonuclease, patch repair protein
VKAEDPARRSATMRAVKSRDTTPELAVRALLRRFAPFYRLHRKDVVGNPDIAYLGKRRAIFVHGCFWHGHDCARGARMPKANADYWRAKIARNRARDAANVEKLRGEGWRALTVWECELKDLQALEQRLRAFLQ